MPLETPIEQPDSTGIYVYEDALVLQRGEVERQSLDLGSLDAGSFGGALGAGCDAVGQSIGRHRLSGRSHIEHRLPPFLGEDGRADRVSSIRPFPHESVRAAGL